MSILLFIAVLAVLILVHELGHFLAAKSSGVRVDEFGLGFPPRLIKKKIGETVYSLNLFPIGGFVKIFGENGEEESTSSKSNSRSLVNKNRFIQAWIISAGVIFNLIFAWMLMSASFMLGVPYSADDERYGGRVEDASLTITQVLRDSPAERAGLKTGDHIIALYGDGTSLETPDVAGTQNFIASHKEISLAYLRNKEIKTIDLRPISGIVENRAAVGISMDRIGVVHLPLHEALYAGFVTTSEMTAGMFVGVIDFLKNMFLGEANMEEVAGPVGIAGVVKDASLLGFVHVVILMAIISINLAIINLLPFPALDGGRLLFLLVEAIKRSPIKPEITNAVNGLGFVALIFFMLFVTYHDVAKIMSN